MSQQKRLNKIQNHINIINFMFYYFENKKNRHLFLHSRKYKVVSRLTTPVQNAFSYSNLSKGRLNEQKHNIFSKKRSLLESINCKLFAISNNTSYEYKQKDDKNLIFKNKKRKKNYTSYSKLSEIKLITIGIASPLRILQWAEKTLPNGKIYGEVLNANTLHHKTFKPQKGGLFCERIFGPLKDFECACGKVDKSVKKGAFSLKITDKNSFNSKKDKTDSSVLNENGIGLGQALAEAKVSEEQKQLVQSEQRQDFSSRKYCPDCDVEYTWSVIRRYQLGYIKLSSPVTHIWFLKGTPSYLSLLLDMKKRYLQFVTYCSETLTIEKSSLPFYTNNDSFLETLSSFKNPSVSLQTTFDSNSNFLLPSSSVNKAFAKAEGKNDKPLLYQIDKVEQEKESSLFKNNGTLAKKKQKNLKKPIPKKGWSLYTLKNKNKEITIKQGAIILSTFLLSVSFNKNLKKYNYNVFLPITLKNSEFLCERSHKGEFIETFVPSKSTVEYRNEKDMAFLSMSSSNTNTVLSQNKPFFQFDFGKNKVVKGKAFSAKKEKLVKTFLDRQMTFESNPFTNSVLNADRITLKTMLLKEKNFKEFDNQRLLNNSFDNQRLSNNSHASHVKKVSPKLFSFAKKLPLDLYILFSIERFVHKSSVRLSIQKTWESIYKQAFFKTIQKSKIVFKYFSDSNFASTNKSKGLYSYRYESKNNVKNSLNNSIKEQTSATILRTLNNLQMLKRKYNLHVLKSLQSLKQPIFSLSHTTVFSKKNSFIDLENLISLEIKKYLIKNTNFIQDSLIDSFLKSLILDQFLTMYNPLATMTQKENLFILASSFLTQNLCLGKSQEGKDKNKLKNLLFSYKNYFSLNAVNVEQISNSNLASYKFLWDKSIAFVSFNSLDLSSEGKSKHSFGASQSNQTLSNNSFDNQRLSNNSHASHVKHASHVNCLTTKGCQMKHVSDVKKEIQKNTLNAEYKKKRKKIYNNVYTLSHRERWDNDKEWQFFSLYSFGVKDYADFPIYTYKNRLSSVLQSIDFSYSQAERHKNRALTAPKGEIEIKQSNSFYSGAGIVQQLLNELDFYEIKKLDKQNRLLLYQINKDIFKQKKKIQTSIYNKKLQTELKELCKKRDLLIRRTKLVRKIFRKNTNPSSMVLTIIPVLPPDLRPIVKMGNQIAASDLNRLYQRVIYRNERLKKFLKDPATSQSYEMKYAQRLLQEAVDNLMQNGKSGPNTEKDGRGRALKSLSDILKGKQGRFRQFLLGKRVDYSGRSVIVVGPKLKLYECGLPVEMAKELYLPFLLKRILNKNYAKTVVGAKTLIQKNPSLANELLREIMQVSPVLLNRAPTLHRLGIQAFIPKLIEGRAILLHPLVCAAFNADFDGDQMAVHVPITIEARAEAWKMMLSRNNILSPATGDPLAIPSQDMVLGCYYLTTFSNKSIKKSKNLLGSGMYFKNFNDVIKLYEQQLLDIHALVWVKFGDSYLSSLQNKKYINNFLTTESSLAETKARVVSDKEKSLDFVFDNQRLSNNSFHNQRLWNNSHAKHVKAVKSASLIESTQSTEEKQRVEKKAIIKNETPIQKIELIENENDQEDLFEIRISPFGQWQEITSNSHKLYDVNQNLISQYICTTPGRILFNLVIQKTIDKE